MPPSGLPLDSWLQASGREGVKDERRRERIAGSDRVRYVNPNPWMFVFRMLAH
jgi:hypothetical protein